MRAAHGRRVTYTMVHDNHDIDALANATVFDSEGKKVGTVGDVYFDDQTQQPAFVSVNTGLFGMKETFVPYDAADRAADGISVPFTKDFIKDAPNVDADGHLTPEEERRVFEHYGMQYDATTGHRSPVSEPGTAGSPGAAGDASAVGDAGAAGGPGTPGGPGDVGSPSTAGDAAGADRVGRDAPMGRDSAAGPDHGMAAHEGRQRVDTESREARPARLRKRVR